MQNSIVLVTSISPKNIENQQKAMSSWIASGFQIISCNVRTEIEQVKQYFPNIEFAELPHGAEKEVEKPCPYVYDMLQILKQKAGEVCGIINSDIHINKCSPELYHFIENHAKEALVYIRRQEVDSVQDIDTLNSYMFFEGIDSFFFPKAAIDKLNDDGLIIGQAMWDYWIPIMLHEQGISVIELINPIAFHVKHQSQWRWDILFQLSKNICAKYFNDVAGEDVVEYLKDKFLKLVTDGEKICYVADEMQQKRILFIGREDDQSENRKNIQKQTYCGSIYWKDETIDIEEETFDYIVKIPYRVKLSKVFVQAVLWIMENYNKKAMHMFVYFEGNITHMMKRENGVQMLLEQFNKEIERLAVYTREEYMELKQGQDICLWPCRVCLCSVLIEENLDLIWERQKIAGRTFLFPAGYATNFWLERFRNIAKEISIEGLVDNNPAMIGSQLQGVRIYSPDILNNIENYDNVLVISDLYADEIVQQLKEMMIPTGKIVVWKHQFHGMVWREMNC